MNLTFLTQPGKTICFSTILKRLEAKHSPHPHRLSPSLSVVSVLMSWYALKYAKSTICSFTIQNSPAVILDTWKGVDLWFGSEILKGLWMNKKWCHDANNDNFPLFSMFGTAILPKVLIYDFGLEDDFFTTWKGGRYKKYWDQKTNF